MWRFIFGRIPYSAETLRGLKSLREALSHREYIGQEKQSDQSTVLINLPYVDSKYQLFAVILPQPYTYAVTSSVRELLARAEQPSRVMDLASEIIIESWQSHPSVAGILATMLSSNIDRWQPKHTHAAKLDDLCIEVVSKDDWSRVATVEPLAFAKSGIGDSTAHRAILERFVTSRAGRDADAQRVRTYYGTNGTTLTALFRHWHNDRPRGPLFGANDVGRAMDALTNAALQGRSRQAVVKLLASHSTALVEAGENQTARQVMELVSAHKSLELNAVQ